MRGRNRVGSVDREVREAVKKCQISGKVVIQNKIVTFMSKLSHTKCRSFMKCWSSIEFWIKVFNFEDPKTLMEEFLKHIVTFSVRLCVCVAFLLFTSKDRGRGEGHKWRPEAKICTSNNNKNKIKE